MIIFIVVLIILSILLILEIGIEYGTISGIAASIFLSVISIILGILITYSPIKPIDVYRDKTKVIVNHKIENNVIIGKDTIIVWR